ncbi:isopentenyl-diphosphate Delta-isomerase [Sphingobacteriales bacterium UPWRP_1]|nr:isopentenyl-diphosphate delta-isomerase [Sphingobacteriales bacterium TSM_CSM]PSJ76241.1 isopentenyl-diphosphate Delta-isomerase [Sphingobacteriales bacterium UPWRP_1]
MTTDTAAEYVVLVNKKGKVLGTEEKMAAHQKGLLHKAFSVFIFNSNGQMLLQQRAFTKYHFGGLWSNSCCSHPRLNEPEEDAAHRRLQEELGFDTPLKEVFRFIYRAQDEATQLIEHELDAVFVGIYDGDTTQFNPDEVNAVRWISIPELFKELNDNPQQFTYWFKTALLELTDKSLLSVNAIKKLFK